MLFKIVGFFIRLYIKTLRISYSGIDLIDDLEKDGKKFVVSVWHGHLFCYIGTIGKRKIFTIISKSKDGDMAVNLLEGIGAEFARGSSSKGGVGALKSADEFLKNGYNAFITVDGPKGPKFFIKPGVIYLAKRADRVIIPTVAECSRYKKFNSWDNFILPLPFSKVTIYVGKPILVSESMDKNVINGEIELLRDAMMELTNAHCNYYI